MPALTDAAVIDGTTAGGFDNLNGLMLTLDGHALRGSANGLTLRGESHREGAGDRELPRGWHPGGLLRQARSEAT